MKFYFLRHSFPRIGHGQKNLVLHDNPYDKMMLPIEVYLIAFVIKLPRTCFKRIRSERNKKESKDSG